MFINFGTNTLYALGDKLSYLAYFSTQNERNSLEKKRFSLLHLLFLNISLVPAAESITKNNWLNLHLIERSCYVRLLP